MSSKAPYGTSGAPTTKVVSELEAATSRALSAHSDKTLMESTMLPISTVAKDFWGDPVIGNRMVKDAQTTSHIVDALRMARTTGTEISMQANAAKNPSKAFAVKPIKNGYLVLDNSEEFYCADLAAVGARVVAVMAAHMMG